LRCARGAFSSRLFVHIRPATHRRADAQARETQAQLTTPFRLASISKVITGTAIGLMIQEGMLGNSSGNSSGNSKWKDGKNLLLHDILGLRALDGGPLGIGLDANFKKIKIKHLLNHTAGWKEYDPDDFKKRALDFQWEDEDIVNKVNETLGAAFTLNLEDAI